MHLRCQSDSKIQLNSLRKRSIIVPKYMVIAFVSTGARESSAILNKQVKVLQILSSFGILSPIINGSALARHQVWDARN